MNDTVDDVNSSNTSVVRKRQVNKNVKFDENIKFYSIESRNPDYNDDSNEEMPLKQNPRSFSNFCWLIASILVFYYSDIVNVIFVYENQIYR